jgi:RNA-directed DNA polymerase
MARVAEKVSDGLVLDLIEGYLRQDVMKETGRTRGSSLDRIIQATSTACFGAGSHTFEPRPRSRSAPSTALSADGYASILRKQAKRPGRGRTFEDHRRWPNVFFADRGLFTLKAAHESARDSR